MPRMFIDCREFPSDKAGSVAICADDDKELLEAAVQQSVACHGHQDSPEFRQQLQGLFKTGTAPLHVRAQKTA